MTRDVIVSLAVLGILGQLLVAVLVAAALLSLVGVRRPLELIRTSIWGYELWLAFLVAGARRPPAASSSPRSPTSSRASCAGTSGSACTRSRSRPSSRHYFNDHRAARYLLPLPVLGAGVSIYHLLVENGLVEQTQACLVSAPGGCATKWVDEFGYVTIPTLALTGFALVFAFLVLSLVDPDEEAATVGADA